MMPPGYVAMPPPGSMQGQPVFLPPQAQQFNQLPPQYVQAPQQQRPVVRGAPPDEKKPVHQEPPLSLPAPDKLGITPQAPVDPNAIDWNAMHAYTKSIGALSFGTDRSAEGGFRCSIVMPTAKSDQTYRIDGNGATEAEAVRVCLDKTYRWLKQVP